MPFHGVIQLFCSIVVSVVHTENCILQAFAKSSQDKFQEERFWLQLKNITPKQILNHQLCDVLTIKAKNLSMKPSIGYSHKPTCIYWANCHLWIIAEFSVLRSNASSDLQYTLTEWRLIITLPFCEYHVMGKNIIFWKVAVWSCPGQRFLKKFCDIIFLENISKLVKFTLQKTHFSRFFGQKIDSNFQKKSLRSQKH